MEFEEQSAAVRQMKELLRDQSKFRAKLDRVVRKIETSSERTAQLAERNKTRKQPVPKVKRPVVAKNRSTDDSDGTGKGNHGGSDSADGDGLHAEPMGMSAAV